MLDEKELKDMLKKDMDNYQIKLTASDILKKYNKEKEEETVKKVKPWYLRKSFIYSSVSFVLAVIIILPISIIYSNKSTPNSNTPIIPTNNQTLNKVSYELVAGANYLNKESVNNKIKLKNKEVDVSEDQFEFAIDKFDNYFIMINSLSTKKDSYYTEVDSDKKEYAYCLQIDDMKFYYSNNILDDDEQKIDGLLVYKDNSSSKVHIEKEIEDDEVETKTTIYNSSTSYIKIEKEIENNEAEYSLEEYENDKLKTKLSFDLEDDEKTFEIEELNFEGVELNYELSNYSNEKFTLDFEGEINEEDVSIKNISYQDKAYTYKEFTYNSKN